jgi:hypothetical protein
MRKPRIVEDEAMTAMDLAVIIEEVAAATVVLKATVASTKKVLRERFDFAFLDVGSHKRQNPRGCSNAS